MEKGLTYWWLNSNLGVLIHDKQVLQPFKLTIAQALLLLGMFEEK